MIAAASGTGSVIATGSYQNKLVLRRPRNGTFWGKWEVESLSPISLSVSALEVPRRFGHMGKTARKHQTSQSQRLACNISQADFNKNREEDVKKEWP